jgi:hypothetical protein
MANTALSRQATRVTYIASLLLYASVAVRGISDYAGDSSQRVAIVLLLAYLLLFVTASWLRRRLEWYPTLYLALQTALVLVLLLLNARFDYFAVLYVPLYLQATLRLLPEPVTLAIVDDGVGFNSAGLDAEEDHFGFTSMRERAELLGGSRLGIESCRWHTYLC